MKKYIFKITLILFLLLQLFSVISFANTKTTIYLNDAIKYKNKDEITVEVCIKNVDSRIVTLGLDLFYDKSKLEYIDSNSGKDLTATIQLAENIPEESRVAIGIVSLSGLKKDGIYYTINFKVKEINEDIPLKISVREATDSDGNDIEINSEDGFIKQSEDEIKEEKKVEKEQQINNFEKTDIEELENIETIIIENGNVEISSSDNLIYETENSSVLEVLDDGTIIPNQDGKTNVRVKLNDQTIGNVEIEVKDGKITKISGNEEKLNFEPDFSTDERQEKYEFISTNDKENSTEHLNKNNENLENQVSKNKVFKCIAILIMVITILFIIFYLIKKNRGGKK